MPGLPRLRRILTRRQLDVVAVVGALALVGGATGVVMVLRSHSVAGPAAAAPVALPTPALQAPHAGANGPLDTPSPSATASPTTWVAGALLPRTLQQLDLHAPYAAIPLHVSAPSIGIDATVLGVGLTAKNAVDAPEGPASSPLWDEAFWYRGGAEPGQPGVFALAGHVDRVGGAPAAFAHLPRTQPGDVVDIADQRTHLTYHYKITDARAYSLKEVASLPVLDRIYGPDVDLGQPPHVPADGVARISIITCTGTWQGSQYDHRFLAFGVLVDATPS